MLLRLLIIGRIMTRERLEELLPRKRWPFPLRQLFWLYPWNWMPSSAPRGERLRKALEALGPIAIKFGQALSTRRDLLPADIATELAKLQDQAPPFSGKHAAQIVQTALGAKLSDVFAQFDLQPLASASVAQIHPATLPDGQQVIVKVLRPDIHRQVRHDLEMLASLAKWAHRLMPVLRPLKPREVVAEYAQAVHEELDLRIEAANTTRLKRNFRNSSLLYVPKVHWAYVRANVAVMERIQGIAVDDAQGIDKHQLNRKYLAETGVRIFFTQVFKDNFFHADMHPGNVYLNTDNPQTPNYIALDCAVMASLDEREQYYLARNLLAIFQQDYQLAAELLVQCGWVASHTRISDLARALSAVCSPILNRPLGEISFGNLLVEFFATARRFDLQMRPELMLLQKTLLQVEGLGRQLYPMLDLWSIGRPFLQKWLRRRYAPARIYRRAQRDLPIILSTVRALTGNFAKWQTRSGHLSSEEDTARWMRMQNRYTCLMLLLWLTTTALLIVLLLRLT